MNITYFIDNKLGGVTSLNYNLAAHSIDGTNQTVVHIDQLESVMSKANIHFPVNKELYFKYSTAENGYARLKRLKEMLPLEKGVFVLNYDNEMELLDHYSFPQTTYQLVHDNYNLKLAKKFGHITDVFICHNTIIYEQLKQTFPGRAKDIFYLPHGVNVPANYRKSTGAAAPLKLLFLGRMVASKGIYDLPLINEALRRKGVAFEWTCIGNGPELKALKALWSPHDKVSFLSPVSNKEVLDISALHDVFVLPTKFEGSPVSLLETMSVGLVPVITDLPGGITDVVNEKIGFTIPVDDNEAFATAIATLYYNKELLESLSKNCRKRIIERFDINNTARAYHELFSSYEAFYKIKEKKKLKIGARLDHPFIPSFITKMIRSVYWKK